MIDAVVKVGGSLLADPAALSHTMAALELLAPQRALLIVPGGGPFADTVRAVDRQHGLPEDAAHWMAILGMDQYAVVLHSKLHRSEIVGSIEEIAHAQARGLVPVLAPHRWLREADPLPHSWDVTSDSIAAWLASVTAASHLILIKPDAHDPFAVVDRHFPLLRAPSLKCSILTPSMLTGKWFPE